MELDVLSIVLLAAVGFVGGMVGGLLGIGGSVIFIPAMDALLSGGRADLYVVWAGAALVCNVGVGAGGALGHWRSRRIIPGVVRLLIPLGIAAAIVGVLAANTVPPRALWIAFGAVCVAVFYRNVRKLLSRQETAALDASAELDRSRVNLPRASAVALPTGFLAGMLGIGGGIYNVPSQQIFLGMPQKNAIANSSASMVAFCTIAAIVRNSTLPPIDGVAWHAPLLLAAVLVPTAVVGAMAGGHLTHRLPDRLVRLVFTGFIGWTIWKCFVGKGDLPGLVADWLGG